VKLVLRLLLVGCLLGGLALAQTVDEYNYFSTRLTTVKDDLHLTPDQQQKVKPILEQETSLMGEIYGNPVLSRKDKLEKYWSILNESQAKIKPMLSADQQTALTALHEQQKQRFDTMMEQAKEEAKKRD